MNDDLPASGKGSSLDRAIEGLILLFALAAPWSIAAAEGAVIATAALLVARAAVTRRPLLTLPWTLWAVVAFLAAQALSIPFGVHPARSLRCFRGSWVMLFVFVFWQAMADARSRRRATVALVVSGALAGLYGVVQHWSGRDWLHHRALENYGGGGFVAVGNLNSHLTYAGVILPLLFLALGVALDNRGARRLGTWGAALLLGLGVLLSFTRTAWIGAAAGLAAFGLLLGRRAALVSLGALALIGSLAALIEPALARRLASIFQSADDPRWRLWQTALRIVGDHPWTGAGLGSFKTQFPLYKVPGSYMSTVHPHHDFLNALVETGLIGATAWLSIWIAFLREAAPRVASRPGVRLGAIAAVVALLAAGLGQCYSTDEEVAQVWWFVVALGLHEAGVSGSQRRTPIRALAKSLKAASLPLLARLLGRRRPHPQREDRVERILVIRPDNRLGNLLLLTPFLTRLREARPKAEIVLLAGEEYAPLTRDWPWIDRLLVQDKRLHARAPWEFLRWARSLRAAGWDVSFEMSNHNTHSYYSCLLALQSGAIERIGFHEPRNRATLTRAVAPPEDTLHFSLAPLRLLHALGIDAAPGALACPLRGEPSAALLDWFAREGLRPRGETREGGRFALVHLGGRDAKAWPLEAWARTLPRLLEQYDGRLVLMAGPEERERLAPIARDLEGRVLSAPRCDVRDLAFLLRSAHGYLGCDSGVMHLAVSVDTPTVALFFRSNPLHYAPLLAAGGAEHQTVLLANPYRVEAADWNAPQGGTVRSRLLRAESSPEASRLGQPEVGEAAIRAVLGACRSAWSSSAGSLARTALHSAGRDA
ncbi:MAG: glycosyltransferase family 9 protein [Candidatus Eisenbacteria bacterium]